MTVATANREKPIRFRAHEVPSVMSGAKTQTRRLIKGAPTNAESYLLGVHKGVWAIHEDVERDDGVFRFTLPYAVGDLLYVRETWQVRSWDEEGNVQVFYKADPPEKYWALPILAANETADDPLERACEWIESDRPWEKKGLWRPSIHMPKWAARLWLEVTAVRVERLQEISEADARAEGVLSKAPADSYVEEFMLLWNSLSKPGSQWADNPWVAAYEFRRIER